MHCAHKLMPEIRRLSEFHFIDPHTHRDEGVNVRHKAKAVAALISDDHRLREARAVQAKQYWVGAPPRPRPRRPIIGAPAVVAIALLPRARPSLPPAPPVPAPTPLAPLLLLL